MATAPTHGNALHSVLPEDLPAALFSQARPVSLPATRTLFLAGAPGDGCYRVDEGLLKVTMASPSGGERILAILGSGALVGELSMLDGAPRSASVVAIRDSKLRFVSRADFEAFARANPDVYRHMTVMLARRLRVIDDALTATSFLTLKGRVARAMFNLADAFGKDVGSGRILIGQKVSQRDLAAMAGIARENLSRILQDWMRRKLVSRLAGYYCLEDKSALELDTAPPGGTDPALKGAAARGEPD
jgi:CRP-like cAMP-binding protein